MGAHDWYRCKDRTAAELAIFDAPGRAPRELIVALFVREPR
jgi:hypothetical protein